MASSLLEEIPTFTVKPNFWRIVSLKRTAASRGEGYLWAMPVKSRKHSSMLTCSMSGVREYRNSMSLRLQALYKAWLGDAMTRFGHFFLAAATGSPVRMPKLFAWMDLARTMPWRLLSSPPIMAAISRRSGPLPLRRFSTEVQLR